MCHHQKMDAYSYQCGVIDAFNEVVKAGVKRLALSHPVDTLEQAQALLPFSEEICKQYGNRCYLEESLLITDLFPAELNEGKYNILYYRDEADFQRYLRLKEEKQQLIQQGAYCGEARRRIAFEFGRLLSYSDEAIERYLETTAEHNRKRQTNE